MNPLKRRSTKLALVTALAAMVAAVVAGPALAAPTVNGSGATFPAPLYQKWASNFKLARINYVGVGSGAGISAIKAGTVTFGGTDAPLSASDLSAFGLVQFPSCVGGLVPIVNIQGVGAGKLKLTGTILAGIYLGTITNWNNAAIRSLNPGLGISGPITVVHRSDSSGSTWIFTHYLAAVNGQWKSRCGPGSTTVPWPKGIAGNGSNGVATLVKQRRGAIGYVEYAYAQTARIPYVKLRNRAGKVVSPNLNSFRAAAASARWAPSAGFATIMVNARGTSSWPIAGASFVLMKKNTGASSYASVHGALQYFDWAYKNGTAKANAKSLQYVSMPSSVVTAVEKVWRSSIKAGGKPAW
jgi:phosphate transport system substrate-binding protein